MKVSDGLKRTTEHQQGTGKGFPEGFMDQAGCTRSNVGNIIRPKNPWSRSSASSSQRFLDLVVVSTKNSFGAAAQLPKGSSGCPCAGLGVACEGQEQQRCYKESMKSIKLF